MYLKQLIHHMAIVHHHYYYYYIQYSLYVIIIKYVIIYRANRNIVNLRIQTILVVCHWLLTVSHLITEDVPACLVYPSIHVYLYLLRPPLGQQFVAFGCSVSSTCGSFEHGHLQFTVNKAWICQVTKECYRNQAMSYL